MTPDTVSPDTRAGARYNLAMTILDAHNADEIMRALALLGANYAATAVRRREQGHQASSDAWTKAADEILTVFACANINRKECGA